ncbi:MAG: hypothetical protein AABZ31_09500 [Bdellovibrionota bacterium]
MLKYKRQIIAVTFLSALVFGFQNCSEMQFSDKASGEIVSMNADFDDSNDNEVLPPPAEDEGVPPVVVDEDDHEDGKDCKEHDHGRPSGDLVYQCILDGPGKSVRAGFISDNLANNGRTPDSICTTQAGCELIGEFLPLKEIVARGSCKNNPHVVHLSVEQISALIDGVK